MLTRFALGRMRQRLFAVAVRPDPVVADSREAVGQGVQQQAARWSSRFSVPSGHSPPEQTR